MRFQKIRKPLLCFAAPMYRKLLLQKLFMDEKPHSEKDRHATRKLWYKLTLANFVMKHYEKEGPWEAFFTTPRWHWV